MKTCLRAWHAGFSRPRSIHERTARSCVDWTGSAARSGFKPEIDATPWLVKKATHTINDSGFETALGMEMRDDPTTDLHRSHFRKGGA
jgi:phage protein D